MSFYTQIEAQPKLNQEVHLPKSVRQMTADKGTIEYKQVLPPMNYFCGIQRLKPQSSFSSTNLFQAGSQLDFWSCHGGFLEQLRLNLTLQVNPAALAPLSIIGPYLLDRVEIYDSNQNIMQTVYADTIFLERINWTNDKSAFENAAEGVNNTTYTSIGPLAAGTSLELNINIPCAISDAQLKGNIVDSKILIRVYFSNNGIVSGSAADLFAIQADILQHAEQLAGPLESKEICKKRNSKLHYRCLNPTRIASFAISNATAGQPYDVQLVSGTQMSAYIVFMVRATPITSANILTLINGITFELYDQSMTLQGVTQTPSNNRYIVAQKFGGSIFNSALGGGIYCLPFSINIQKSYQGNQQGFYALTTRETLRLIMPSTLVTGNYVVDVYSLDYAEMIVNSGKLDFKK